LVATVPRSNALATPVRVVAVSTSCDCLSVAERPTLLEPNAVATLTVAARPTESGLVHYAVFLELEEPRQLLMFTLSGQVYEATEAASSQPVAGMLVTATALRDQMAGQAPPLLLDLRPQSRFVLGHIPGSLNLPLHEIRARPHLYRRAAVLLDEGDDSFRLAAEAVALAARGKTSITVLAGGLRAWRQAGGTLEGLQPESATLFELDPADAAPTRGDPGWRWVFFEDVVVAGSHEPAFGLRASSPADEPGDRSGSTSEAGVRTALRAGTPAVRDLATSPWIAGSSRVRLTSLVADVQELLRDASGVTNLLFLDRQGTGYEAVERALQGTGTPPWFYLHGGWEGLMDHALQQAALSNRRLVTSRSSDNRVALRSARGYGRSSGCCGKR